MPGDHIGAISDSSPAVDDPGPSQAVGGGIAAAPPPDRERPRFARPSWVRRRWTEIVCLPGRNRAGPGGQVPAPIAIPRRRLLLHQPGRPPHTAAAASSPSRSGRASSRVPTARVFQDRAAAGTAAAAGVRPGRPAGPWPGRGRCRGRTAGPGPALTNGQARTAHSSDSARVARKAPGCDGAWALRARARRLDGKAQWGATAGDEQSPGSGDKLQIGGWTGWAVTPRTHARRSSRHLPDHAHRWRPCAAKVCQDQFRPQAPALARVKHYGRRRIASGPATGGASVPPQRLVPPDGTRPGHLRPIQPQAPTTRQPRPAPASKAGARTPAAHGDSPPWLGPGRVCPPPRQRPRAVPTRAPRAETKDATTTPGPGASPSAANRLAWNFSRRDRPRA